MSAALDLIALRIEARSQLPRMRELHAVLEPEDVVQLAAERRLRGATAAPRTLVHRILIDQARQITGKAFRRGCDRLPRLTQLAQSIQDAQMPIGMERGRPRISEASAGILRTHAMDRPCPGMSRERAAESIDRGLRALELEAQGWQQREIASELGLSPGRISVLLRRTRQRFEGARIAERRHAGNCTYSNRQVGIRPEKA